MVATQKQQEFAKILRAYLESGEAHDSLRSFLHALKFIECYQCISVYFDLSRDYANDKNSLRAFNEVITQTLEKSYDPYFALRFEALGMLTDTPWSQRYLALEQDARTKLATRTRLKKGLLSWTQKEFLKVFNKYIANPKLESSFRRWISNLTFPPVADCLLAYIEVSLSLSDTNQVSLKAFLHVSLHALGICDAYFAAQFEKYVSSDGSVWKRRFDALHPQDKEEILSAIEAAKEIASSYRDEQGNELDVFHVDKIVANPEAAPMQTEDERPSPQMTPAQSEFVKQFHEFVARDGHDKKADIKFQNFMDFASFPNLRMFIHAYLGASTRYSDYNTRSLDVFYILSFNALAKGDAYYAKKYNFSINQPRTLWERRYRMLRGYQQEKLQFEITKAQSRARIIDDLKFAYFQANQKDPELNELQNFSVVISDEQWIPISKIQESCDFAFRSFNDADFEKYFDALFDQLKDQKDLLLLLAMVQRCRKETGVMTFLRHQFRWYMVGLLYIEALKTRTSVYNRGFKMEELDFFFEDEDINDPTFSDFTERLDYIWLHLASKHGFTQLSKPYMLSYPFTQLSKAYLVSHLFAWKYDMRLVPSYEAAAVRGIVDQLERHRPGFLEAIKIPIESKRNLTKTLKIYETIGKVFIVWWNPSGPGDIYFEMEGFGGILFSANSQRLGRVYDEDITYREIYRGTEHLSVLIQTMFEFLGYLPDLLSGGVTGVIKSVAFNIAFEKIVEKLGLDPTVAQLILLGADLLSHALSRSKSAIQEVEPDYSLRQRGTQNRATFDRGTANPHSEGLQNIETNAEESYLFPGEREEGGHRIRGEPDDGTHFQQSSQPSETHTDPKMLNADGVTGKGTDSSGLPDASPEPATRQGLALAEQELKEAEINFNKAYEALEQKQKWTGHREAMLEKAKGKKYEGDQKAAFEQALKQEKKYMERFQEQKTKLEACRDKVNRLKAELTAKGELDKKLDIDWNLPDKPVKFRSGTVEVDSYSEKAFIPPGQDRTGLTKLLNEKMDGDLSRALLDDTTAILDENGKVIKKELFKAPKDSKMADWKKHPEWVEYAHVLSKREGGREVCILMTKARNREFSGRIEHRNVGGAVFKEEAIVIDGIAIDRQSALDLVKAGRLPQSAVDKASKYPILFSR